MSILGVGAGAAADGLTGGAASAFESALSMFGGSGQNAVEKAMLEQALTTIMDPMLMNMASHTQKIIKGDSSGML